MDFFAELDRVTEAYKQAHGIKQSFYPVGTGPDDRDWQCSYCHAYMSHTVARCWRCDRVKE